MTPTEEILRAALIAWQRYQQCDDKDSDGGKYLWKRAGELTEEALAIPNSVVEVTNKNIAHKIITETYGQKRRQAIIDALDAKDAERAEVQEELGHEKLLRCSAEKENSELRDIIHEFKQDDLKLKEQLSSLSQRISGLSEAVEKYCKPRICLKYDWQQEHPQDCLCKLKEALIKYGGEK